jgi:hypothetical protein
MPRRALLSDTERAAIAYGDGERQRKAASQVQKRINKRLAKDLELLREHHPDLYNETRITLEELDQGASLYSE